MGWWSTPSAYCTKKQKEGLFARDNKKLAFVAHEEETQEISPGPLIFFLESYIRRSARATKASQVQAAGSS